MAELVRVMPWPEAAATSADALITREWLVTNGLGGYASGTVAGVITRRFHGYLVAALPNPLGRVMMLNEVVERFTLPDGQVVQLAGEERFGAALQMHGADYLTEFRLDEGLPEWRYKMDGFIIQKRLMLPHRQNTVYVNYRILDGEGSVKLSLRPSVNIRPHEAPVSTPITRPYTLSVVEDQYEIVAQDLPPLRMVLYGRGAALTIDRIRTQEIVYRIEESRGYEARGDLWSPGYFQTEISKGADATLVASTEPWEVIRALSPVEAWDAEYDRRNRLLADADPAVQEGPAGELVLSADQFIIRPAGRLADTARAQAAGDEVRTVIAGYHWFTDWGRDTMISLEGLTLTTGRHVEASYILRTFAHYIHDGLIPNMFPEGEKDGLYHTADATLWFFHAIDRYLEISGDRSILRLVLPKLLNIVDHHLRGTRFGIHVDPADDLLVQGAQGYQLTWMDAKVGDWVVTPRRGKAVEINALWYNALRLLEQWLVEENRPDAVPSLQQHSERTWHSFNNRFWNEAAGYLFDVVDSETGGNEDCLRPNQLFSISLRYPVLDPTKWKPVVDVCNRELVTPVGLRSLARSSPDYKPRYDGDLRSRDAAYHQGTVWSWLIGPFVDAYLKVYPDDADAHRFLDGFTPHLGEACIGSISEIFDAEPPYTPRGCIAQAWGVAEVLRSHAKVARLAQERRASTESLVAS